MRKTDWLVFFYSVPSRPVANRVRLWRKLARTGFVSFKGAVYLLPYSTDNYELCQWLLAEVDGAKGEAAFIRTSEIEGIKATDIVSLFDVQRNEDYRKLERRIEMLETKVDAARTASARRVGRKANDELDKLKRDFQNLRKIDFFGASAGKGLEARLRSVSEKLKGPDRGAARRATSHAESREMREFQGKTWVTRSRPFVDRMASAWLISRFIDKRPKFQFVKKQSITKSEGSFVSYDIEGGTFTHIGDLCTFEVLMKSFGLKDRALKSIAELVHELDLHDGKFKAVEAPGLYEILSGIRKSNLDDLETLQRGMLVFDMMYKSKS